MDGDLACVISPHDTAFTCTQAAIARPRSQIAEDDPNLGLLLETILGSAYETQVVDTARELLVLLESEPADLILLDYQLPDINGVRAMEVIRRRHGPVTPVIA